MNETFELIKELNDYRFLTKKKKRGTGCPKNIKIKQLKNGCIVCTNIKPTLSGYYSIRVNVKRILLHRKIYELKHKIILSKDLFVCHKCDNPRCVNIEHLFYGTIQDNNKDKVKKNRQSKGEKCNKKLTSIEIKIIRRLYKIKTKINYHPRSENRKNKKYIIHKYDQKRLSNMFKIAEININKILHKKTWKHIK